MPDIHDVPAPYLLIALAAAMMAVGSFFESSRDAVLKSRLWPVWMIISSVLFTVFGGIVGGLPVALFMLAGSLVYGRINLKRVRFCPLKRVRFCPRGQTLHAFAHGLFGGLAQYCPACGSSLEP